MNKVSHIQANQLKNFYRQQGNGYNEVPPPEVLSFSSTEKDASLTFMNSTSVQGVLIHHGRAFEVVASADSMQVCLFFET